MKKILLMALLILTGLSGCGLLKTVTTSHSSQSANSKTDSVFNNSTVDHSTITTHDFIDTLIKTKPVHIESVKPAVIDSTGIVTAMLDTLMVRVKFSYNALTKAVTFGIDKHSELVQVKMDRTTLENRDVTTKTKGQVTKKDKTKTDTKQKTSEPEWNVIATLIGSVILVFAGIFLFIKYKINTVI